MTFIKRKITIIAIIILICVLLFFTLWDIIYEQQLIQLLDFIFEREILQRILILYIIFTIFLIVLILLQTSKKFEDVLQSRRIFEKLLQDKLYYFKCPKCNEVFTINKSRENDNKPFIITCPSCGMIGKIPSESKSRGNKFICKNCGEQIVIWAEKTNSPQNIEVLTCPYCGEKQSMKNI